MAEPNYYEELCKATNTPELSETYNQWSDTYEDETESWGWAPPIVTVSTLMEFVEPENCIVLDAGCGTGSIGALLQMMGFNNIHGIDISDGMLEKARAKSLYGYDAYNTLEKMDLNQKLPIESDRYDVVTCGGCISTGAHVQYKALHELIRVTKPGGIISFTVREIYWHEVNFIEFIKDLETQGKIDVKKISWRPYVITSGEMCAHVTLRVIRS